MTTVKLPITGECQCGALRYQVVDGTVSCSTRATAPTVRNRQAARSCCPPGSSKKVFRSPKANR